MPNDATIARLRQAILLLTNDEPGISVDANCPNCGYPELSARVRWPAATPLGVAICRKCGEAMIHSTSMPTADVDLDSGIG